jgi:hypothetical protein
MASFTKEVFEYSPKLSVATNVDGFFWGELKHFVV